MKLNMFNNIDDNVVFIYNKLEQNISNSVEHKINNAEIHICTSNSSKYQHPWLVLWFSKSCCKSLNHGNILHSNHKLSLVQTVTLNTYICHKLRRHIQTYPINSYPHCIHTSHEQVVHLSTFQLAPSLWYWLSNKHCVGRLPMRLFSGIWWPCYLEQ